MRVFSLMVICLTLSACSLFGGTKNIPEGEEWREQVSEAIATTPGVEKSSVTVHDVDNGMTRGPVMRGTIHIGEGENAQEVVDAAMRAAADIMGENSSGVSIHPGVTESGQPPGKLSHYSGYENVRSGEQLWNATR